MDTSISSLSYIKWRRLDNDIKTKLAQIMKLKENHEKNATFRYRTRNTNLGVYGAERFNADTSRPQCRRYQKCYNWTGQVGCVKTTTRNLVKLQKYAFLKQNNFMRIDELPYYSSLFYKLIFVSRRQFSINIGKYPSKVQKVRNDPFLGNKIFKRRVLFSD